MRASELMVMMRSRLRDDAKEGWSDAELLSSINFALSAIAHRLMPWKGRHSSDTIANVDTYSLPEDFMAPISLLYDGAMIPIKGVEYSLSNTNNDTCAFIDNDALILAPVPLTDGVVFHLNYHALFQAKSVTDILPFSNEYADTVLYYALSLSLQKEASEQSLAQSKYYLSLFEDRCKDTANIASKRRTAITTKSSFQKV